jgi:hypothetical protein
MSRMQTISPLLGALERAFLQDNLRAFATALLRAQEETTRLLALHPDRADAYETTEQFVARRGEFDEGRGGK